MRLEILFVLAYALAVAILLGSLLQLTRFLADTREIRDQASLERFKALARVQMYLALSVMGLMGLGLVSGLVLTVRRGLSGLAVVVLANLLVLGLGMYHKKVEARTRSLPAGPETLAEEYRRVSETWVKKAIPNF